MAYPKLHGKYYPIIAKNITVAGSGGMAGAIARFMSTLGELLFKADAPMSMWFFDGSMPRRIHGLDMAMVLDGDILTLDGEILWLEV